MTALNLPGGAVTLRAGQEPALVTGWTRTAYAAAHVVSDPLAEADPWVDWAVDWDRTLAFREHLWSLGFGVAEAMDTAQRGMGLDWPTSLELIRRSTALARSGGHLIASGAGTDHLTPGPNVSQHGNGARPVGSRAILPKPAHWSKRASPTRWTMRAMSVSGSRSSRFILYAADRACVNTVAQALDLCDRLGDGIGVACDVYHVWWGPDLSAEIERAGIFPSRRLPYLRLAGADPRSADRPRHDGR